MRVDIASRTVYPEQVTPDRAASAVGRDGVCLFFENSTVCRNVSAMFVLCCFCLLVISAVPACVVGVVILLSIQRRV